MAKEKVKAKGKAKAEEKTPKTRKRTGPTITSAVLEILAKNPSADTQEISTQLKKLGFDSKFNKKHLAWYKYQIRKGKFVLPGGAKLPASTRATKAKVDKKDAKASSKASSKKSKVTKKVVEEDDDDEEE